MKLYTFFILLTAFMVNTSVKPGEETDKGSLSAMVDSKSFKVKEDQLFRGMLISKAGSMDGRTPARTVISVNFYGPSYNKTDGKAFNESMQFEISYEPSKTGEPSIYVVSLQYQSTDYSMIKEQSKIKITQFTWEADRKHFNLSAEFDCKMRSWGYPSDGKKDVSLKGKMSDIRITVPSWVTARN